MSACEELHGSSQESFEDAAVKAMGERQDNWEMFEVSLAIERGGFIPAPRYHATLTPKKVSAPDR